MNKCIALLFVSIIMLASVLASGCTLQSSNQNATSNEATVNQTLKTMVEKVHDMLGENKTIKAWKVTWIDADTVKLDYTTERYNASENTTTHANGNSTIKRFNAVNDATNYLNSQVSGYKLDSTTPANDSVYIRTTGHKPSTAESWIKINERQYDYYNASWVVQTDNFIHSINEAVYHYAGRLT